MRNPQVEYQVQGPVIQFSDFDLRVLKCLMNDALRGIALEVTLQGFSDLTKSVIMLEDTLSFIRSLKPCYPEA